MPTLGVDFSAKTLPAKENTNIRLHLWDVAGQILKNTMFNECKVNGFQDKSDTDASPELISKDVRQRSNLAHYTLTISSFNIIIHLSTSCHPPGLHHRV